MASQIVWWLTTSHDPESQGRDISMSKTAGGTDLVTTEHLQEINTWEWNGHVINDVKWPRKVKVVTPIHLEPNISKTAADTDLDAVEYL